MGKKIVISFPGGRGYEIIYYDIEEDVNLAIETSISRLKAEGHI